ncbi:MAG: hypothetical protein IIB05_09720, partial [Bacteroidetes bacterium]|nr:hypothetical protein [Bacteroidota bacterium]
MNKKILTYFVFYYLIISLVAAQNGDRPESPDLKRVTVDTTTGHAWIFWSLSPSPEVTAYIIHIEKIIILPPFPADTIWMKFDTIFDAGATYYQNINSNATVFSESYVISALAPTAPDYKESPFTKKHATIFTSLEFDSCNAQLILSWTPYIGWEDSLKNYFIYRNTNSGPFSFIDSMPPGSTTYLD